jgi:hypothetical protein
VHVPEVSDVRGRVHDDDLISGDCDDALQQPAAISQSKDDLISGDCDDALQQPAAISQSKDDLISGDCDDALQQPAAISQSMVASYPVIVTMPFRLCSE